MRLFDLRALTHYDFLQRVCSDTFAKHKRFNYDANIMIANVTMQARVLRMRICIDGKSRSV